MRLQVERQLCEESTVDLKLSANHFLVSLRTLADNGFLVFQPNVDRTIDSNARANENMWQLTDQGRQFAETYLSASLRPKRQYIKKSR